MDTSAIKPCYPATYNPNYVYSMPENCVLMINVLGGVQNIHWMHLKVRNHLVGKGMGFRSLVIVDHAGRAGIVQLAVYFAGVKTIYRGLNMMDTRPRHISVPYLPWLLFVLA